MAKQSFRGPRRLSDNPLPGLGRNRRLAPPSGQVGKPLDAAVAETIRPGLNRDFGNIGLAGRLALRHAVGAGKDDPRTGRHSRGKGLAARHAP